MVFLFFALANRSSSFFKETELLLDREEAVEVLRDAKTAVEFYCYH